MRIGIDGYLLSLPFACGGKHYAEQLTSSLAKVDKINDYIIFSRKDIEIPNQFNFRLIKIPSFIPLFKRQFFLTYFAKKEGVDVFHFLAPFGSMFSNNLRIVTTIHDLDLNRIYPKKMNLLQLLNKHYYEFTRKYALKNSSSFITVSKFTKNQLKSSLRKMQIERPIKVIYEAPSSHFRELNHRIKTSNKGFFLCMGDYSPRKNVPKIIEAYHLLSDQVKHQYKLRIVISTNIPRTSFLRKAKDLGILRYIKLIEAPKLERLIELYNQATVFLFPSLYEGFGLPILEAMACGCPVITSNYGAMKEVSGNAAYLINPNSSKEIAKAMEKIVKDKKLARDLRLKGLKRAKSFSWEETAKRTLSIYKKVSN